MLDGLGQAVDALEPSGPLSPYYEALGRGPLSDGVPWIGWALLAGHTALVPRGRDARVAAARRSSVTPLMP